MFILQALFPRLLGATNYGNFDFLVDSANKFIGFFETGTSIAFYTKLSQNNTEKPLIKFYWLLLFGITFLYLLFILIMGLTNQADKLWPNQTPYFVLLSALWGVITLYSNTAFKILDACNLTIKAEQLRITQLVLSVAVFLAIYCIQASISLSTFFYVHLALIGLLVLGCWHLLKKAGFTLFPAYRLTIEDIKHYLKVFWVFSSPLFLYSAVGLIVGIGDRWILQKFGGSVQQAFFGISYKIGAFVFLFTSAMMPLLMREYSRLFANNEIETIKLGFVQNFKLLYFLSSFLAVFVAFNAGVIIDILAGSEFYNARMVVILMAFYPIHQTLGQLNGTVFYSTSRTKEYRNIGLSLMPLGLGISFILIAPHSIWGYNMGAIGLAIQMLGMQFITVNIMLIYNCRYLQTPYLKLLVYQLLILGFGVGIGYIIDLILAYLQVNSKFFNTGFFFMTFSLISGLAVFVRPTIVGLKRSELNNITKSITTT